MKKYEELHETFKNDILSSDEKVINYFRALSKGYVENISAMVINRALDVFLYAGSLYNANYIKEEQAKEMAGCLFFYDAHITREFEEFNRSFIRKYGNGGK